MPFCSLCNKEYDDKIENCTLSHCVSCGSTRLWTEKTNVINPISLIVIFGFFVIVFLVVIVEEIPTVLYYFIGAYIVFIGIAVNDSFKSRTVNLCLNCFAKGFIPLNNVKLQDKRNDNKETFSHIDPEKIQQLLRIDIKTKDKSKLKNILIIIGLAITIIGIVFSKLIQSGIDSIFN